METKTKNKFMTLFKILLGGIFLLFLFGWWVVFHVFFPMAPPSPHHGSISACTVSLQGTETVLNSTTIEQLFSKLEQATPTRHMSANDNPDVSVYYTIHFIVEEIPTSRRVFLYELGGQVYYEIPYGGIYKTDYDTLTLLTQEN